MIKTLDKVGRGSGSASAAVEKQAWKMYCEDTAGDLDVRDNWESLSLEMKEYYILKSIELRADSMIENETQTGDVQLVETFGGLVDEGEIQEVDPCLTGSKFPSPERMLGFADEIIAATDSRLMEPEFDPSGIGQHEPGAKLDAGKNRLGLVLGAFSRALWAVGEVGTYGAEKYTDGGWLEVEDGLARYTDAMYRHLLKDASGELEDQDTELLHLAHAAWNALAALELVLLEKE